MTSALTIMQPTYQLAQLTSAGASANRAAAAHVFSAYAQRRPANTLRRQRADLATFTTFLVASGVNANPTFSEQPEAWAGITWGLVAAFVQWQLAQGYAIGSINVRLSTIKTYAKLAAQAGALSATEYAMIRTVSGFRYSEGRNVDAQRETTRVGAKKATTTAIGAGQALMLKDQASPRDALLLCILLDHGLRCGEVAGLTVASIDLAAGTLTFYREKVHKTQTHRLSSDTLRAAMKYLPSRPAGALFGMSTREINRTVGELGARLGIEKLSPHDLRHAFATAAVKGGTSITALQEAGGWSSIAMPSRYVQAAAIANEGVQLG